MLVACFLLLGVGRIVSTYHVFATTGDEPAHIACGLQYVAQHIYHYETQHPPLTRAMIALLPYLSGTRPRGKPTFQLEGWDLITYEHHPEADRDAHAARQPAVLRAGMPGGVLLGAALLRRSPPA